MWSLRWKSINSNAKAIRNLVAARFAADVMGVPTVIFARTDANAADLITSDADPYDHEFLTGERQPEGFYPLNLVLTKQFHVVLLMHHMLISFGVKLLSQILKKLVSLLKRFMRNILVSCLLITVHHHLTGKLI